MKRSAILFIFATSLLLASCQNGSNGNNESKGENDTMYHGEGTPDNSLGEEYSHYYDEISKLVYEKRDGVWINQFTIGSPSLYSSMPKNNRYLRALAENIDDIRNALINTLYSTNYTCLLYPVFENADYTYEMLVKVDKGYTEITDIVDKKELGINYGKIDEDGKCYVYLEDEYCALEDGSNYYCTMPFPTLENILYQNFLLIDDDFGQLTSIVCSELNNLVIEDGYYVMKDFVAHHGLRSSHYYGETYKEGNINITYKFKLDDNNEFLKEAEITFNCDYLPADAYGYDTIHYDFSDVHTTIFEHP